MSLERELKHHVLDLGADFVGIASQSRFEHAPDFSDPKTLLPEFRSVIAFGIAMNRGFHITSVLTEAELTPDPLVSDEDSPCHPCKTCLEICPEQAMSRDQEISFVMEGQEHSQQRLDGLGCAWGCAGLSAHHYRIPEEEIKGLLEGFEGGAEATGYAASEDSVG